MSTMTPQDRVRQQIAREVAPEIVLALYKVMKGSRHARHQDVSPEALATLTTEVLGDLLSMDRIHCRIRRVNQLQAHGHALGECGEQDVILQAKSDIERYGSIANANFGNVKPGFCWVCKERITPAEACVLELSATLKVDVHGSCCSKDEKRFELLTSFAFRLIGGAR